MVKCNWVGYINIISYRSLFISVCVKNIPTLKLILVNLKSSDVDVKISLESNLYVITDPYSLNNKLYEDRLNYWLIHLEPCFKPSFST